MINSYLYWWKIENEVLDNRLLLNYTAHRMEYCATSKNGIGEQLLMTWKGSSLVGGIMVIFIFLFFNMWFLNFI